jgi:hypothetical protein
MRLDAMGTAGPSRSRSRRSRSKPAVPAPDAVFVNGKVVAVDSRFRIHQGSRSRATGSPRSARTRASARSPAARRTWWT